MSDAQKQKLSAINKEKCRDPKHLKMLSDVQKNGASIFTTRYWIKRGMTLSDATAKVSEIQRTNSTKSTQSGATKSWMKVDFWTNKGLTDEQARLEISARQSKMSARSSKFTGCKRSGESKKQISITMSRRIEEIGRGNWSTHFGKFAGRSKVESECYTYIHDHIENRLEANVPIGPYIVDMIVGKKIVEFYGDFWHANPTKYVESDSLAGVGGPNRMANEIWEMDKKRVDNLATLGYDVLIVWESEWNDEREDTIKKIEMHLHGNP